MKILCTGDLHLGRRSSRLPEDEDGRLHSAAAAWGAAVDLAIGERVDLVAISGDLVDQQNRFFEAFGPLERGIRRLGAAGIPSVAVAGNHDCEVLPRLAGSLGKSFRLLGEKGRWEATALQREGRPALGVVGWSFPAESGGYVRESPLSAFPRLPAGDFPVLALLHADLDQPNSVYAPVSSAELRATGASFWLLGHIHAPRLHEQPGAAPLLYPGSPQALDPGEPGAHGAWIVELKPGQPASARRVPLSTVRYDEFPVDVGGIDDPLEVKQRIAEAVRAHAQRVVEEGAGRLRAISCRLVLTGRTRLHSRLGQAVGDAAGELEVEHGEVRARVERIEVLTRPAADLDDLARANDAPGVLARLIRALESNTLEPTQERLLADLAARSAQVRRARPYQPLAATALASPEELRGLACRQAYLLLDQLLGQKEGA